MLIRLLHVYNSVQGTWFWLIWFSSHIRSHGTADLCITQNFAALSLSLLSSPAMHFMLSILCICRIYLLFQLAAAWESKGFLHVNRDFFSRHHCRCDQTCFHSIELLIQVVLYSRSIAAGHWYNNGCPKISLPLWNYLIAPFVSLVIVSDFCVGVHWWELYLT